MKKIYPILVLVFCICTSLWGQERYLDEVFCEVEVIEDVEYCTQINFSLTPLGLDTNFTKQSLAMDLYLPVDDALTERPLVIYLHTGNFLSYPTNGLNGGGKKDSCAVAMCTQLAKRGFVAASIDYRLGWNPLAATQPERAKSLIRASYRAMQDSRVANRFFRKDYEQGNQYGIDTSQMTIWGQGTGGFVALMTSNLDDYEELLAPQFFTTPGAIPMVTEEVDGDIYGTTSGIDENGVYISLARYPNYSSDYHMAVHLGGGIDTSFIDENSLPTISYQVASDESYNCAPVLVNNLLVISSFCGAYPIQESLESYGLNFAFDTGGFTDPYTEQALSLTGMTVETMSGVLNPVNDNFEALYPFIVDSLADSNPWEWYSNTINASSPFLISKEKSLAYIDTIMNYFAPRAVNALDLEPTITNGIELVSGNVDFGTVGFEDVQSSVIVISNPSAAELEFPVFIEDNFFIETPAFTNTCGETSFVLFFIANEIGVFSDSLMITLGGQEILIPVSGEVIEVEEMSLNAKVLLEGAYAVNGQMANNLSDLIPLNHPYNVAPYNYNGNESLDSIPTNMVDWILIEARSGTPSLSGQRTTITEETKAALLLNNGTIVDLDGSSPVSFSNLNTGEDYHFCIRHRNHLDVLSATAITAGPIMTYDFTLDPAQAFGPQQQVLSADGVALLYAADFNQDGTIQVTDYDSWQMDPALLSVYNLTDANLDGTVQVTDYDLWFPNKAKLGSVEIDY